MKDVCPLIDGQLWGAPKDRNISVFADLLMRFCYEKRLGKVVDEVKQRKHGAGFKSQQSRV